MIDRNSNRHHENLKTWYLHALSLIALDDKQSPRGLACRETIAPDSISFWPQSPIINPFGRDIGTRFMAAEAAWIMEGSCRLERINQYAPLSRYSDDGETLAGAYGPRIAVQIDHVLKTLMIDRSSRQAVMTIWRPSPEPSKDIPCTVSLQFLIRDGALYTVVNMRSSDIWLGLPYDVFTFSVLSGWIAAGMNVDLGELIFQIGSFHIYEKDVKKFNETMILPEQPFPDWDHWNVKGMSALELSHRLWMVADGLLDIDDEPFVYLSEHNRFKIQQKDAPTN